MPRIYAQPSIRRIDGKPVYDIHGVKPDLQGPWAGVQQSNWVGVSLADDPGKAVTLRYWLPGRTAENVELRWGTPWGAPVPQDVDDWRGGLFSCQLVDDDTPLVVWWDQSFGKAP